MSKRMRPASSTWKIYPFAHRWSDDHPEAQEDRFEMLAHGSVHLEDGRSFGPYSPDDTTHYRLMQLRCRGERCGAVIGSVWSIANTDWQGRPFTWVETFKVVDRDGEPGVWLRHMLIDSVTEGFTVWSECVRHEWKCVTVAHLAKRLNDAVVRLQETGRSLSIDMLDTPHEEA